jgi:hypothetical protein
MIKDQQYERLVVYKGLSEHYAQKAAMLRDTAHSMLERGDVRRASYFFERVRMLHLLIDEIHDKEIEMFVNDCDEWHPDREGTHMSWYHTESNPTNIETEKEND